jgi:hypothetical protein
MELRWPHRGASPIRACEIAHANLAPRRPSNGLLRNLRFAASRPTIRDGPVRLLCRPTRGQLPSSAGEAATQPPDPLGPSQPPHGGPGFGPITQAAGRRPTIPAVLYTHNTWQSPCVLLRQKSLLFIALSVHTHPELLPPFSTLCTYAGFPYSFLQSWREEPQNEPAAISRLVPMSTRRPWRASSFRG